MTTDSGHGLDYRTPPASAADALIQLAGAFAALERRIAAVEDQLREGPRQMPEAEWVAPGQAWAIAGISPATGRRWRAAGLLTRGRGGRVNLRELRQLMANGGEGRPGAPADLAAERAKRAAATVLEGRKR